MDSIKSYLEFVVATKNRKELIHCPSSDRKDMLLVNHLNRRFHLFLSYPQVPINPFHLLAPLGLVFQFPVFL